MKIASGPDVDAGLERMVANALSRLRNDGVGAVTASSSIPWVNDGLERMEAISLDFVVNVGGMAGDEVRSLVGDG